MSQKKHIKNGNIHLSAAILASVIGVIAGWYSIQLYKENIDLSFLTILLTGVSFPVVIRNSVEAAIYFSRAED